MNVILLKLKEKLSVTFQPFTYIFKVIRFYLTYFADSCLITWKINLFLNEILQLSRLRLLCTNN